MLRSQYQAALGIDTFLNSGYVSSFPGFNLGDNTRPPTLQAFLIVNF